MTITVEQITAGYELEKKNRRPPMTIDDLPFVYEDITPEWLTAVLCGKASGAKVESFQLDVIDNGNSNRRRIFITYNEAGRKAGLPERVFCKATQGLANRVSLGTAGALQVEVNFYNNVRPLLDIEAPIGLFARYNAELNSIIMMQDLDAATQFCTHTTQWSRQRAEEQMQLLAKFHGQFLDNPQLKTTLAAISTWPEFFGRMENPDLVKACDKGFAMAEEVVPPRLFARRQEIWPATRKSIERHHHLPQTLTHGDVHLRNWYIAANGKLGLTDWQSLTRGHWSRDFIYALATSLTVENRRLWDRELLRFYLDQLQESSGRSMPVEGAFDEVRRQLTSVLAFWTMTINPPPGMPDMQPRDSTLEFIRRITTAIDDLDALD